MSFLDRINKPNDIKDIPVSDLRQLALEIRRYMLENVSKVGGHMASSLGVVELTMALHLFLDLPKDKLIFDVGHQSYAHKILTGRKEEFKTLRQFGGISGFPKISESDCDAFDTGHSSTSISAGLGLVKARDLRGTDEKVVAVIGDGALSGGMAFEALNNAGRLKSNFIIVLNDNKMSISENVGGMANYLGNIRTNPAYNKLKQNVVTALNAIPEGGAHIAGAMKRTKASLKQLLIDGMFFEDMDITYIGPIDGHNISHIKYALELASRKQTATLVHVVTKKGKGYRAAEQNPVKFHGIGPFDKKTGEAKKKGGQSFTDVFSKTITELAEKDDKICAITAAMAPGTGLTDFSIRFPERFTDVGIAEEHAVTFAAGLAAGGFKPVFAVYSTFLQRAYDQIIHDVCLENLPVVFAVDRTGIVGPDGETHQGIYTNSFLPHIPGLTVLEPKNAEELKESLKYAFNLNAPCAVCYAKRQTDDIFDSFTQDPVITTGKAEILSDKGNVCIFGIGPAMWSAAEAVNILKDRGIDVSLVNLRFANPIDTKTIISVAAKKKVVVTVEENIKRGGIGEKIEAILAENNVKYGKLLNLALPDAPLKQGKVPELKKATGTDGESIANAIKELL
ncbi:MAG: 1-deoxy-D-xylulose-5-phosphate synthase [Lachnospiraceae bacterium]|nr:1-deoxy-D-xylulose-5-phosphate synthase [Lachnospiraceae bacterium]